MAALTSAFGVGLEVRDPDAREIHHVWPSVNHIEVAVAFSVGERRHRALWTRRQAGRGVPLLVLVPAGDGVVRVLGPSRADEPIREVALDALLRQLGALAGKTRRAAASDLAAALERMDRGGIPGVVVRGLLTRHLLTRRLRRDHPEEFRRLEEAAARIRAGRSWRENMAALGFAVESRPDRGYLLRHDNRPVAVVHPFADPAAFARMTAEGSPPEGLLIADCRSENVRWGLLATDERFRLFPAETSVGAATARYLEIDLDHTSSQDWVFVGLLAPESLAPGGILERLVEEAAVLGNELRETVERQIRDEVLPALARGLAAYVQGPPRSERLESPNVRQLIEDGALLLLFRLIFFLYLEHRGFLPYGSAAYRPHSATQLLLEARRQGTFDERATTLWDRFTTLVRAMRTGNTAWGLPPYDGDLFAPDALEGAELLEEARLSDATFGLALAALGRDPEAEDAAAGLDYGDLEIAHLGRIYEGLLSLRLSVATEPLAYDPRSERWGPARDGRGAEIQPGELFYQTQSGGRKAQGVYYTPQVIVRHLVDHAVLPALEAHLEEVAHLAARDRSRAAVALFEFRICDPAMGSAHFLADALDRVSERIATFLAEHPLPAIQRLLDELRAEARWEGRIEDGDLLRRLVLKRCIYGVDLNPVAVEVARISLWLASFVPGLSLAYLGHNLRVGDALVGVADPAVLEDLGPVFAEHPQAPIPRALARAREVAERIAETPDRTPEEVEASREAERELQEVTAGLEQAFSLWCAEPFGLGGARHWLQTAAHKLLAGESAKGEAQYLEPALRMAEERRFFHWPVEFPEVFARKHPGFDVVIGNPPWEELTVEELAFYALHDPGLRGVSSERERQRRIGALLERFPHLQAELGRRRRELEDKRRFFGPQGGYVLQGPGDTDTYKLFCERYRSLTREGGWLGVVLPRSAFLVDGARRFRRWLFAAAEVRRLDFIVNTGRWAFDAEPRYTIALLAARRTEPGPEGEVRTTGPSPSPQAFQRASVSAGVPVPLADLKRWTETEGEPGYEVPLLPRSEAVAVFDRMRRGPRFDLGYPGAWRAFPVTELHETADKRLFRYADGVPVWKGRSFDQYDPHGADPAGFADEGEVLEKLQAKRTSRRSAFHGRFPAEVLADPATHPYFGARVAFRDVTNRTNSRTVIACLVPPRTFLTNSAPYLVFTEGGPQELAFVLGVLNSLPFDWQARRYVETHMNFYILDLLCFPPPGSTDTAAIAERAARLSSIDGRFADFARACGVECGPLEPDERDRLRAEIDALVARAYGLSEADFDVVFSDFTEAAVPQVYRRAVEAAYDALG